jgi:peptidoglycan/LPS O-acetylase OafA/YrhL
MMAKPDRKDARRPLELLGLSAILGVFIFVVVWMGTRKTLLSLEFAGVAFIVALVAAAMLSLAARPTGAERADIEEQDRGEGTGPRGH